LRWLGRRWRVLLEQRLGYDEDDERKNNDDEEPALGAGLLLRILIFGQSLP